jgi:hypothetical protein
MVNSALGIARPALPSVASASAMSFPACPLCPRTLRMSTLPAPSMARALASATRIMPVISRCLRLTLGDPTARRIAYRRSIYLHDRTDTRHEIKAGPRATRGTTATGKVTLLHRFAGIRPTKPGNRSRGGWTSISSDHSIMLTPAGVESLHLRDAPAELTSRTDRPSRLRAETATHPDSHVRQPCETATRYHRLARGNPPATLLWGEVPPLAQRAGLLGLHRISPPRPTRATVPLPPCVASQAR